MDNPILYTGVGGLLAVFFLVLIYFFTKTWRWFQIVVVFCVFVASIFLVVYAAPVHKTRLAWQKLEAKTTKQIEDLSAKRDELRYGNLTVAGKEDSIQALNGKIGRAVIDLGRVWRNCTPQGIQPDGSITVSTAPPAGAAPAEAPAPAAPGVPPAAAAPAAPAAPVGPPPNRIEVDTVLYVFVEAPAPPEFTVDTAPPEVKLPAGTKIPRYYLGEFRATAATDTTVSLAPVLPLTRIDMNIMSQGNLTWSLYETLPVDGHELFSLTPESGGNLNESAEQISVFGEMKPELLNAMLLPPDRVHFEADQVGERAFQIAVQRHAVRIQNYIRDGKRASPDDPPLNTWLKIRFKEKYSEEVDSAGNVSALQLGATDDFFDRGLAEIAILKRGSKAEFKPGDVAVFPQDDGNRLLQEKTGDGKPICELVEPVYVRTLNNYAFLFRENFFRLTRIQSDIVQISRDIAQIQQTQKQIEEQLVIARAEQAKVRADIDKTNIEKAKIAAYLATLEKSLNDLRARLSVLYRTNLQLEEELEQANKKLTDEINRRTQSVAEVK